MPALFLAAGYLIVGVTAIVMGFAIQASIGNPGLDQFAQQQSLSADDVRARLGTIATVQIGVGALNVLNAVWYYQGRRPAGYLTFLLVIANLYVFPTGYPPGGDLLPGFLPIGGLAFGLFAMYFVTRPRVREWLGFPGAPGPSASLRKAPPE